MYSKPGKFQTQKSQSRCPCCFSARADSMVFCVGFPGPRVRSLNSVRVLFARANTVVFFVGYPGPRVRSWDSVRVFVCAGGYGGFLGGLSRASGTITEFRPRFVCGGANAFRKLIFGGGCGNKPYGDSDISVKVFSGLPPFFPVRVSPRNTTLSWLHVLRRTFRGARGRDPRRIVRSHGAVPPVRGRRHLQVLRFQYSMQA